MKSFRMAEKGDADTSQTKFAYRQMRGKALCKEKLVLPDRIELSTSPLPRECSTTELRQQISAMAGLLPQHAAGRKTARSGFQSILYSAASAWLANFKPSACQTSTRAEARATICSSECNGDGARRKRSAPRGTVG